jgi:putative nucleotidyltransferase with HDIG domain
MMSKILIVDDEKSIRFTFSRFLTNIGHTVFTADNVEYALQVARENKPDMVLTDIVMPKYTGIELLKEFALIDDSVPVVIMTGEPSVKTATEALRHNAYDYLQKPIDKDKLLNTVKRVLEFKKVLDENEEYRTNLEGLVEDRTKSLSKAIEAIITTIIRLLEFRDPYTAGHDKRVGNLAYAIGSKMGLEKDKLNVILIAGYLHDIGKIAIPAEILSKPGKLTEMEFNVVKAHATYSYTLLKDVDLPWPIADIIHKHHERLDGSGYPLGLKGEDIMMEARILMVADVIEAMLSHRPYRPALPIEVVLDELETNMGSSFDQTVAETAISLLKEDNYILENSAIQMDIHIS